MTMKQKNKKGKKSKVLRILSLILSILVILLVLVLIINLIVPELINIGKMLIDKLNQILNSEDESSVSYVISLFIKRTM